MTNLGLIALWCYFLLELLKLNRRMLKTVIFPGARSLGECLPFLVLSVKCNWWCCRTGMAGVPGTASDIFETVKGVGANVVMISQVKLFSCLNRNLFLFGES